MENAFEADLVKRIINDVGIVKVERASVSTKIGVTKGPPKITPEIERENLDYDGKTVDIEGLDRDLKRNILASFTLIQGTDGNLAMVEPGATKTTTTGVDKYQPKETKAFYAAGDYLTNLQVIYPLGNDGSLTYVFPKALVTKYELMAERNGVGMWSVEVRARLAAADAATNDRKAPYHILVDPPTDDVAA